MNNPITLPQLIKNHQQQTGDSYQDIATRGGLSKATVGHIMATKRNHIPHENTLQNLAKGLKLPLDIVKRAAMTSAGMAPTNENTNGLIDVITHQLQQLPEGDVRTVASVVAGMLANKDG